MLVNEYTGGRLPVYHFDTYRLKDDDEFLNLGPDEYFDSAGITFVEWADRVATLLPPDRLEITIDVTSETERRITLRGTSPEMETLVDPHPHRLRFSFLTAATYFFFAFDSAPSAPDPTSAATSPASPSPPPYKRPE